MTVPSSALALALAFAAVAFVVLRARLGRRVTAPFAASRGSAAAGERWALTAAFLPQAKESARRHLPSYLAGIGLHLAVFAMLARLVWTLSGRSLPRPLEIACAVLLLIGLACGIGLFVKRAASPALRALSAPEDYAANLLVGACLALGAAASLDPRAVPAFQGVGAALALYAPFGKLRHMVFLVTSRRFWGRFFGQRGVKPAPPHAPAGTLHG